MPHKLAEGLIDRLLAYYQANIAAKAAAINAEYADGVLLVPPENGAWFVGERRLIDGPDYPQVFLHSTDTNILRYSANMTDADHVIKLMVAVQGMETDVLQRLMYRFGRVFWEMTVARWASSTPDDYFALHGNISLKFDPPTSLDVPPPYIGKMTLTFTGEKQEEF